MKAVVERLANRVNQRADESALSIILLLAPGLELDA